MTANFLRNPSKNENVKNNFLPFKGNMGINMFQLSGVLKQIANEGPRCDKGKSTPAPGLQRHGGTLEVILTHLGNCRFRVWGLGFRV